MFVDEYTIRRWTQSAWSHLGLELPCDLHCVCDHLGLNIESIESCVQVPGYYVPGVSVIGLNNYITQSRLRFTLAHEIGHHIIGQATGHKYTVDVPRWMERLCDRFATELLMPADLVREQASDLGHPDRHDKTGTLAARFDVSISAMRYRLRELGLTSKTKTSAIIHY
ncbi:MAG: ImmA/IrrE family metallo-endopeptidase [Armatimonadota bacterium]|nr:ImmA/IrrE family metallo-endopeptidase [bacterium]